MSAEGLKSEDALGCNRVQHVLFLDQSRGPGHDRDRAAGEEHQSKLLLLMVEESPDMADAG